MFIEVLRICISHSKAVFSFNEITKLNIMIITERQE